MSAPSEAQRASDVLHGVPLMWEWRETCRIWAHGAAVANEGRHETAQHIFDCAVHYWVGAVAAKYENHIRIVDNCVTITHGCTLTNGERYNYPPDNVSPALD